MGRNVNNIEEQLIADEGKKASAYQDKLGYWTVGVGTCIDGRLGCGLSEEEQLYLLRNRVADRIANIRQHWPWTEQLDPVRLGALVNMSYQMGIHGLENFKKFLTFLEAGDYPNAKLAMLDSLWNEQDPARAGRLAIQIETGVWQ